MVKIPPSRLLTCLALLAPLIAVAEQKIDFNRDIQPVLSENCYACHGPDEKGRKAELRLDKKDGAFRTKDDVTVVKPGDLAHSELIARITTDDADDLMPPPKSKKKLTSQQIDLLKRWVEQGAPWSEHWAFVAPKRPEVSKISEFHFLNFDPKKRDTRFSDWSANPIDAFILTKLAEEKLDPSPEAPPEKIIRRMTLDLTGIPPTLEEVDAFVSDYNATPFQNRKTKAEQSETARQIQFQHQRAIENLADRLLASPRYGERMVWDWLDAARYADTNGYQGDPTRAMWYWRDWAIHALNDNMAFDRFTIQQIAGDLLASPTTDQLIATGFHRNHMINGEGGRIAEESRAEYVQDRVETTAMVWLGLTFTCCRCHDHKYDPFTQRDYYSLAAYFNSIDETGGNDAGGLANPILSLASPEQQKKIDDLKVAEAVTKKEREDLEKKVRDEQPKWEAALTGGEEKLAEIEWHALTPDETLSEHGATLTKQPDGSILVSGTNPDTDDLVVTARTQVPEPTAIRLEVLTDDSLASKGPGRAPNGSWVLTEFKMLGEGKPVELAAVRADFEQPGWPLANTLDGKDDTGWGTWPQVGKPHEAIFEMRTKFAVRSSFDFRSDLLLSFRLQFRSQFKQHVIGKFRLSITNSPQVLLRPIPDEVKAALAVAADQRTDAQKKTVTEFYLASDLRMIAAAKKTEVAKTARTNAERKLPRTMVMRERAQPRDTFILVRGSYDKPGEKVSHAVPASLPQLPPDAPKNRLSLARWLVSPDNPLTARVVVNRYWQTFFGIGLVKTAEDFGVQGEKPSHPELLDWLAREFVESGWDVKHMHRLIVTSAAYRQSSVVPPGMAERDPENRLLARGPRHRLPSWMLRDQALAVSGLLVEKLGGPPVKGYQPPNIWEDATFGQIKYTQDHGDALYRRSLYIFWRRIVGPTLFFDVASRQTCTVKITKTNTPLHALVTLNDVTYVEAARSLAERILKQDIASDAERLAFGFRLCTARAPHPKETEVLLNSLARFREQYGAEPDEAQKLISAGESRPDPKLNLTDLAAHTGVASLLLNLDETLSNE